MNKLDPTKPGRCRDCGRPSVCLICWDCYNRGTGREPSDIPPANPVAYRINGETVYQSIQGPY